MEHTKAFPPPCGDAGEHRNAAPIATRVRKFTGRGYGVAVWAQVRVRHEAGESANALSAEFGMAPGTIHTRASVEQWRLCGGGARATRNKRTDLSDEAWLQIFDLYENEKLTASCLSKMYCVSQSAIRKRLHKAGISKRKSATPAIVMPPAPEPPPPPPPWEDIAHPAQLPPEGPWATWLFQGGRGAGKTRAGAEWLAAQARDNPRGIFALLGATLHDVREVMIDGPAGLMNLPGYPAPTFEASRRRLVFESGAMAYAYSAEEPRRLRGPPFDGAWADEFCAWRRAEKTLQNLRLGLRRGPDPRLVVTTAPRPIKELRNLREERSCVITQAASSANADNLSPRFLEGLTELYGGTTLAAQELEGLLVAEARSGVWTAEALLGVRGIRPAAFDRIIVAVDPPAGTGGSACGIVVAGRRGRRLYVLADESVQGLSPLGWATRVCNAARAYEASAIVAESNQGGEMVRATLASAGAPCAIELKYAKSSKNFRATPVAALYERGLVTHCGAFALLEEELMALDGNVGSTFDRADALVWAVTVLMFDEQEGLSPGLRGL